MSDFAKWCQHTVTPIGNHQLQLLECVPANVPVALNAVASAVPAHYASGKRAARLLKRLGKTAAAEYLKNKLPTGTRIRSGDLGEILGANYVNELTNFDTHVLKLRWKDHRNMAMRGDDVVGVRVEPKTGKLEFLKGEVKSAAQLSKSTVTRAREGLLGNNSRPSPHALEFIADRLHEDGEDTLGDLIDDALLVDGIKLKQVTHLLFTFCGNDPTNLLKEDINAYAGSAKQHSVGLRMANHQAFIKSVFEKVIADANGY